MTHSHEEAGASQLQSAEDLFDLQWGLGSLAMPGEPLQIGNGSNADMPLDPVLGRRAAPQFSLEQAVKDKTHLKKMFIACMTFWFGSKPMVKAGKRQPHNILRYRSELSDGKKYYGDFILGCILFNAQQTLTPEDPDFAYTYDGLMLEREQNPGLYKRGGTKVIIQVFEEFEQNIGLTMGSAITAFPKQDTEDFVVLRFPLVDFSYDPHPTPKQKQDFNRLLTYLDTELDEIEWIYVHCKAGVNRSFKLSTALLSTIDLLRMHRQGELITEEVLFTTISKNCADIKSKRTCVEFKEDRDKDIFQIAFISGLVRGALEARGILVQQKGDEQRIKKHNYLLSTLYALERRIENYLGLTDISHDKRKAATLLQQIMARRLFDMLPSFMNNAHPTDIRDMFSRHAEREAKSVRKAAQSGRLYALYSQVVEALLAAGIGLRPEHSVANLDLYQYDGSLPPNYVDEHGHDSSALFHVEGDLQFIADDQHAVPVS